jgi:hypothetical protein
MAGRQDTRFRPYVSKAAGERAKWIDLGGAVRCLLSRGCDRQGAIDQIRDAVFDRAIPWRWEDAPPPRRFIFSPLVPPPLPRKYGLPESWELDEHGRLMDVEGKYRKFLLSKIWFEKCFEISSDDGVSAAPKRNVDLWAAVKNEVFRLMNHHGEFSDDDPNWNCQARPEDATGVFILQHFERSPSESGIRSHVVGALKEWRLRKKAEAEAGKKARKKAER